MRTSASTAHARFLESAATQPSLPFSGFSVQELLERTKKDLFPDITAHVRLQFVSRGTLACIVDRGLSAEIYIHQLLNHPDTPEEIFQTVVKHELLHLRIPPVRDGKSEIQHPQAFWDAERILSPERQATWSWIYLNLWESLKIDRKHERVLVRRNWRSTWSRGYAFDYACDFSGNQQIPDIEEAGW